MQLDTAAPVGYNGAEMKENLQSKKDYRCSAGENADRSREAAQIDGEDRYACI